MGKPAAKKKRGRPSTGKEKTDVVAMRLPISLRKTIEQYAEKNGRTMSEEAAFRLKQIYAEQAAFDQDIAALLKETKTITEDLERRSKEAMRQADEYYAGLEPKMKQWFDETLARYEASRSKR